MHLAQSAAGERALPGAHSTWNNHVWPSFVQLTERQLPGEQLVTQWITSTFRDPRTEARLLRDTVRIAWNLAPALAVHLCARYKNNDACRTELNRLVKIDPHAVRHIPEALHFLVDQQQFFDSDAPEVRHFKFALFIPT